MIEKEETIPKMGNLQLIEGLEIGTEKLPSTVEQLSEKSERSLKTVDFGMQSNVQSNSEEIIEVEEIEGADKLYKLKVDLGTETRTLVAGMKPYYTKEELEGKKCVVFTNLEPRKIMGIESHGMILAASNGDRSEVKLLQSEGALELGSKIS